MQTNDELLAWWSFDNDNDATATDSVSKTADPIEGSFKYVDGVIGKALKFDGYTAALVRKAEAAPRLTGAVQHRGVGRLRRLPVELLPRRRPGRGRRERLQLLHWPARRGPPWRLGRRHVGDLLLGTLRHRAPQVDARGLHLHHRRRAGGVRGRQVRRDDRAGRRAALAPKPTCGSAPTPSPSARRTIAAKPAPGRRGSASTACSTS